MARLYIHKTRGWQLHYKVYFPDGSQKAKYKYYTSKTKGLGALQDIEQIEIRSMKNALTRDDLLYAIRAKYLTKEEGEAISGKAVVDPTLKELAEKLIAMSKTENRDKTHRTNKGRIQRLRDFFGDDTPAKTITNEMIQKYRTKRLETISATTINKELIKLAQILDIALEMQAIETNPAREIKRLRDTRERKPRSLTRKEIKKLLAAAKNEKALFCGLAYPVIMTYLYTGMRRSELIYLEVEDVNIRTRKITIQSTLEKDGYLTKTGKARVVGIAKALKPVLSLCTQKDRYFFGGSKPFMSRDGVTGAFRALREKAKLPPGITLHCLRHTYITHLLEKGVNPRLVQERAGHSTFRTTWKYAHVLPSYKIVEDELNF